MKNILKGFRYTLIVLCKKPEYLDGKKLGHTYFGAHFPENQLFVKYYDGCNVQFTRKEDEAYKFYEDEECTKCMVLIRDKYHPYTIANWEYDKGHKLFKWRRPLTQNVAYPNYHWGCFGNLQPCLMYMSVCEFHKTHHIET